MSTPEPDVLSPAAPEQRPRSRRALALGTVGALAVAAVGVGTWAAVQYVAGGGDQPTTALPATTLAVVSLDLDPSFGQKVEALEVLRKFPSLKGKGAGGGDADARRFAWNALDLGCEDTTFDDVAPWLGDRAAVAGVPHDGRMKVVFVLEVTDHEKARAGAADLDCAGAGKKPGVAFVGDYMLLTEKQAAADAVATAAGKASLAESSSYRAWVDRAGGPGVLTAFVAKQAPDFWFDSMQASMTDFEEEFEEDLPEPSETDPPAELAEELADHPLAHWEPGDPITPEMRRELLADGMTAEDIRRLEEVEPPTGEEAYEGGGEVCASEAECDDLELEHEFSEEHDEDGWLEEMRAPYKDFEGLAVSVRFGDGDVEAHVATRGVTGSALYLPLPIGASGGRTAPAELPDDSAFAVSSALRPGWAESYLGMYLGGVSVVGDDPEKDWVADIETMLGEAVSLSMGPDVTAAQMESPAAMKDAEAGIRIVGDPDKIEPLLRKYAAKDDAMDGLVIVRGDGVVAAGFHREYVARMARTGALGDTERFRDAVPEAGKAGTLMYADADRLAGFLSGGLDIDRADVEPLDTVGYSETTDSDRYVHGRLRVTTD